jgi:hypothetical protein
MMAVTTRTAPTFSRV